MNEERIKELLSAKFGRKLPAGAKRHIVFWYDEESACGGSPESLVPCDVKTHILEEGNNFATRVLLEREDPFSHYLIYSPSCKPVLKDNWLADILLYSDEFTPDHSEIIAAELGIGDPSVKVLLRKYSSFFKNQERVQRVKALDAFRYGESEEIFAMAVMAAIVKIKNPSFEEILRKVFIEGLDDTNRYLDEMKKYGIDDRFWHYAGDLYGYNGERRLKDLFASLLLTALTDKMSIPDSQSVPGMWKPYLMKNKSDCVVFVDHWMKDRSQYEDFNQLASDLCDEMKIKASITDISDDILKYRECDIFGFFDNEIIKWLLCGLHDKSEDYELFLNLIKQRKITHWYSDYKNLYGSIESAVEMFALLKDIGDELYEESADKLIRKYVRKYYKVDQLYRKFYTCFDKRENDVVQVLQPMVENIYINKFLPMLAAKWSELAGEELAHDWSYTLTDLRFQQDFYRQEVEDKVGRDERRRVFVIISDGLRYEAGEELAARLRNNEKLRGEVDTGYMLGAVPSYTRLCMAALLPWTNLKIVEGGEVFVNGINASDLAGRQEVLTSKYSDSIALKYSDIKDMQNKEFGDLLKQSRVVYIYHNAIDAVGDKAETEKDVFSSVETAFTEIAKCIQRIVSCVSATNIIVTADHGFIYQRSPLVESDKIQREKYEALVEKRRFIIAKDKDLPKTPGVVEIDLKYLLGNDCEYKLLTPKGIHRFKTQGAGVNYIHGGISMQEVIVPLIRFKAQKEHKQKKVDIQLISNGRKITNNKFKFTFLQINKIDDNTLPRAVNVSLWDNESNICISDVKRFVADNQSDNAPDREYSVFLTLKNIQHDKNKDYYLRIEDESGIMEQIAFKINIAFMNDFDF